MAILGIAGGPQAFSSASGGKVYAYNAISTAPAQVAPGNPSRQKITFHNPGTIDLFVAPATLYNGTVLVPTTSALGGCFRVFANGGTLVIEGECQVAWQAFSASATDNPLTVMDTNVG